MAGRFKLSWLTKGMGRGNQVSVLASLVYKYFPISKVFIGRKHSSKIPRGVEHLFKCSVCT